MDVHFSFLDLLFQLMTDINIEFYHTKIDITINYLKE